MFVLTSYEVPQRRLRLLSGDSETNLELGLFDFAFSLSSTRRRSAPQLEGVRKRKAAPYIGALASPSEQSGASAQRMAAGKLLHGDASRDIQV
jgi:hypothetical protein